MPNIAREVSLLPQFPASIPAASVNRACASANSAIVMGHDQIALGHAQVVVAGGAESLSETPVLHSKRFAELLIGLSRAKNHRQRLRLVSALRPKDFVPVAPTIAEPSTGETMGQSAEKTCLIIYLKQKMIWMWIALSHPMPPYKRHLSKLKKRLSVGL